MREERHAKHIRACKRKSNRKHRHAFDLSSEFLCPYLRRRRVESKLRENERQERQEKQERQERQGETKDKIRVEKHAKHIRA